ncbi:MAG: hypothetical protein J1G02_06295 [Clostridiales bacterium]|nr:hypothetical protein [Clostridiales bacterium]
MAKKRMFSNVVIDSDAFCDMPLSAQALYFHLGMKADDDGFIGSPRRIQRNIGASEDDLKLLLAKGLCYAFETGVFVIKDWLVHNTIQRDRYTPTIFIDERAKLVITESKTYSRDVESQQVCISEARKRELSTMETKCFQNVSTDIDLDLVTTAESNLLEERTRVREEDLELYTFIHKTLEADFLRNLMCGNRFRDRVPLYDKYIYTLEHPLTAEERKQLLSIDMVLFSKIFDGIWKSHEAGEEIKDLHRYVWVSITDYLE